jgi:CRISPR-associated endonuclease/helicase Cas3
VPDFYPYWGKVKPVDSGTPSYHLLVYHMLDVAACIRIYLERNPDILAAFSRLLGISESAALAWLPFLVAFHDIGKLAPGFQWMMPEVVKDLGHPDMSPRPSKKPHHATVGWFMWTDALRAALDQKGLVQPSAKALDDLLRASTGHHGVPPKEDRASRDKAAIRRETADVVVVEFLDAFLGVFNPPPIELTKPIPGIASYLFAGMTTLADWCGSDRNTFHYVNRVVPLAEYWPIALDRAIAKIDASGLFSAKPNRSLTPQRILDAAVKPGTALTDLQRVVATMPLDKGPQLILCENPTADGKTEAALILLHRMLCDGARGGWVALPTQATADGIYRRVAGFYRDFFEGDAWAILSHSRRKRFKAGPSDQPLTATNQCREWLGSSLKVALLAHLGVGTIDQALLGIVASRHSPMRLLGLMGKVLLIDEVHAFDTYTEELILQLIPFHVAMGGSVILLSATLTRAGRQRLDEAFQRGLQLQQDPHIRRSEIVIRSTLPDMAYPLISGRNLNGSWNRPVKATFSHKTRIRFVYSDMEAIRIILRAVLNGENVLWISNTVRSARRRYRKAKDTLPGRVTLCHARYLSRDRGRIEADLVARFGPTSTSTERNGQLVLATQVAEQSLDIDFDVVISDLADIASLLQRRGRERRHPRDLHGNRIDGPDARGPIVFYVRCPRWDVDPADIESWLGPELASSHLIYDALTLWRTHEVLQSKTEWHLPQDTRDLIERVASSTAEPGAFKRSALRQRCRDAVARSRGTWNPLDPFNGYSSYQWGCQYRVRDFLGWNTMVLTDPQGGFFVSDADWTESSLSVESFRVSIEQTRQVPANKTAFSGRKQLNDIDPDWRAMSDVVIVAMEPQGEDLWVGEARSAEGGLVQVYYSSEEGLEFR